MSDDMKLGINSCKLQDGDQTKEQIVEGKKCKLQPNLMIHASIAPLSPPLCHDLRHYCCFLISTAILMLKYMTLLYCKLWLLFLLLFSSAALKFEYYHRLHVFSIHTHTHTCEVRTV